MFATKGAELRTGIRVGHEGSPPAGQVEKINA